MRMYTLLGLILLINGVVPALEIGAAAGAVNLQTLDGQPRVMDNYAERRGTAVVFLSARCPVTAGQMAAITGIHDTYRLRGVLFVGVCSNPAEDGEELRTFAQRSGVLFPVYRDLDGGAARQFGATHTPEVFLLDKGGKAVFHGGLADTDDARSLEGAIRSLLAGQPVEEATRPVSGTAVGEPGPKRDIPDPYGAMSFSSELIFSKMPGVAVHHCATIAETPDGDILCVWYAGSYESSEDQALYLSRLRKGERIWSEPEALLVNHEYPPGNAIVFRDRADRMAIVWGRMESSRPLRRGAGWSECRLFQRFSSDGGRTWTADEEIPGSLGWLPRNMTLTLQNGDLALPLSGRVNGASHSFLLHTSDNGANWRLGGLMSGGSQPTVIQRANGELLSYMRSHPYIIMSESRDGGATWSAPERTELECPGSGIAMTRLASGRLLLVHNPTTGWDRTPIAVRSSDDEGRTWKEPRVLEQDWGEFSYPCIIQSSDGMVHVTYTYRRYSIKHVTFDEGWLDHWERPN